MLRVGLTGNLGSGKSTVAALFARRGAHVLSSDAIGRDLMQPGQAVFDQIVRHFGPALLALGGTLDRQALARIAFAHPGAPALDALNRIVHPAVIARQAELAEDLRRRHPDAVLIVESALIFETAYGGAGRPEHAENSENPWHRRFDRIVLVTAPEAEKFARFVQRQSSAMATDTREQHDLEAEARRRLALQTPDSLQAQRCDHVLVNDGALSHLEAQVQALWPSFVEAAQIRIPASPFPPDVS